MTQGERSRTKDEGDKQGGNGEVGSVKEGKRAIRCGERRHVVLDADYGLEPPGNDE